MTFEDPNHLLPSVSLIASTISQNQADPGNLNTAGDGGNLLLAGSTAGAVTVTGTIIDEGLGVAGDQNCSVAAGVIDSTGGSVEGGAIGPFPSGPTNQCELDQANDHHADPLLGPLQDNGGPTFTHALPAGSPALDLYSAGCPATDQIGTTRPQGTACDSGAFELLQAAGGQTPVQPAETGQRAAALKKCKKKPKKKRKKCRKRARLLPV